VIITVYFVNKGYNYSVVCLFRVLEELTYINYLTSKLF